MSSPTAGQLAARVAVATSLLLGHTDTNTLKANSEIELAQKDLINHLSNNRLYLRSRLGTMPNKESDITTNVKNLSVDEFKIRCESIATLNKYIAENTKIKNETENVKKCFKCKNIVRDNEIDEHGNSVPNFCFECSNWYCCKCDQIRDPCSCNSCDCLDSDNAAICKDCVDKFKCKHCFLFICQLGKREISYQKCNECGRGTCCYIDMKFKTCGILKCPKVICEICIAKTFDSIAYACKQCMFENNLLEITRAHTEHTSEDQIQKNKLNFQARELNREF